VRVRAGLECPSSLPSGFETADIRVYLLRHSKKHGAGSPVGERSRQAAALIRSRQNPRRSAAFNSRSSAVDEPTLCGDE